MFRDKYISESPPTAFELELHAVAIKHRNSPPALLLEQFLVCLCQSTSYPPVCQERANNKKFLAFLNPLSEPIHLLSSHARATWSQQRIDKKLRDLSVFQTRQEDKRVSYFVGHLNRSQECIEKDSKLALVLRAFFGRHAYLARAMDNTLRLKLALTDDWDDMMHEHFESAYRRCDPVNIIQHSHYLFLSALSRSIDSIQVSKKEKFINDVLDACSDTACLYHVKISLLIRLFEVRLLMEPYQETKYLDFLVQILKDSMHQAPEIETASWTESDCMLAEKHKLPDQQRRHIALFLEQQLNQPMERNNYKTLCKAFEIFHDFIHEKKRVSIANRFVWLLQSRYTPEDVKAYILPILGIIHDWLPPKEQVGLIDTLESHLFHPIEYTDEDALFEDSLFHPAVINAIIQCQSVYLSHQRTLRFPALERFIEAVKSCKADNIPENFLEQVNVLLTEDSRAYLFNSLIKIIRNNQSRTPAVTTAMLLLAHWHAWMNSDRWCVLMDVISIFMSVMATRNTDAVARKYAAICTYYHNPSLDVNKTNLIVYWLIDIRGQKNVFVDESMQNNILPLATRFVLKTGNEQTFLINYLMESIKDNFDAKACESLYTLSPLITKTEFEQLFDAIIEKVKSWSDLFVPPFDTFNLIIFWNQFNPFMLPEQRQTLFRHISKPCIDYFTLNKFSFTEGELVHIRRFMRSIPLNEIIRIMRILDCKISNGQDFQLATLVLYYEQYRRDCVKALLKGRLFDQTPAQMRIPAEIVDNHLMPCGM